MAEIRQSCTSIRKVSSFICIIVLKNGIIDIDVSNMTTLFLQVNVPGCNEEPDGKIHPVRKVYSFIDIVVFKERIRVTFSYTDFRSHCNKSAISFHRNQRNASHLANNGHQ